MKKKFGLGLFIGRFQPFHNGHLHAARAAASSCRKLIIGIGSSQKSGTDKNPLSSRRRAELIKAGITGTGIDAKNLSFMEIPDFGDNDRWFNYIIGRKPGIDVVFTRNRLVKSIFREHGIAVISPEWYVRRKLSATKIRGLIRAGRDWRDRVPKGTATKLAKYEHLIRQT